ncbi:MAG TPA: ABC transporter substrate-binding protein [Acidimicrobiales bacterium]|nr:ABC transporter substrate-binding protein [Acidimicrobiales bacterium]
MLRGRNARVVASLLSLALLAAACGGRDDDDEASTDTGDEGAAAASSIDTENCVSDPTAEIEGTEIKLVSSFPQSGQTAAFSQIARGWKAYFEMVNDAGGVDIAGKKYTITYEDKDDQYNPEVTTQNIDELVGTEGENAFAVFSVVGTANNLAIRQTLNDLCVPNLFAATGSPAWGNPDYPWLIGSSLSPYTLEGKAFADLLSEQNPQAKVAMLVQDDDYGAAYEEGFKNAIEGTDIEVVKVEKYAPGTSEVSAQITSLAASGADAFFNGGTLLACPDAVTKAKEANWTPITWVSSTCTSKTLMGIAGANGDGVYSYTNLKDPLNPDWDSDAAMMEYREQVAKYQPEADLDNGIVAYGWTQAALLIEALENAEAPTRLAVMESVKNLEVSEAGLLLPGVTVKTGKDDNFLGEQFNVMQYEFVSPDAKNHFVLQGDLVDVEGQTAELSPEDLINS